uniref:hypothetical protein n=1 Tax=Sphingomonas bacterium TaxID=1895847 RepID=UPI002627626A|nr:hypothetical protein [Sphingomonas bacterium]
MRKIVAAAATVSFMAAPAFAESPNHASKLSLTANAAPVGAAPMAQGSGAKGGRTSWIIIGGALVAVTLGVIVATSGKDKAASS